MSTTSRICKDLAKGKSTVSAIALRLTMPESTILSELKELELTGHVSHSPLLIDGKQNDMPTEIIIWKLEKSL